MDLINYFKKPLKNLAILLLSLNSLYAMSQDIPFNCDYNAYLFQFNDVYAIDLASGNSYLVAENITDVSINAAAYNPADGYIWGSLKGSKEIVRIGKNFNTKTFDIPELPDYNRYVGGINPDGIYYLKGGGTTYFKIDLNPDSPTYGQHLATENLSQNINVHDWAFNAVDGQLYTVEKQSNKLYRINPENGVVTTVGEVPILAGNNYTYGAVYFDVDGRFYISANQTGTIYVIQAVQNVSNSQDMTSNLFAFGPSSSSNDGARCPTAPVVQEICDNGIDDDGDGLIDCDDPSCSGYGQCQVIEPPTSGSNDGGLESNNRLSEIINKRNFNRVKNSYKFDRKYAARLVKNSNYAIRKANGDLTLEDFIPQGMINETEIVNATPYDLLNITNATDIYSVDYMKNETSVASIMAIKTENGVYEHTKYICDRLLGAELISVNTMDINEKTFIKSIIKNVDGTYEFVLSFSARLTKNNDNFEIDSHWNLDKFKKDATYYNFQIWANSVDDLHKLGSEVLQLLDIQKSITGYNNSAPPAVFVRKGKYENGSLNLQIVNTNNTKEVQFDGGYKVTETSDVQNTSSSIDLNGQYILNTKVETGNLFDIGFRIGDGIATPDDLFMSDGPWGLDDSQNGTTVMNFDVSGNELDFNSDEYPVERNISLEASTDSYVGVYRALTPRFKAVDLTKFNSFKFEAKGTGNLQVTFVKKSIDQWESQPKANLMLTENLREYHIDVSNLKDQNGNKIALNDVVTIVFTQVSQSGVMEQKTMSLKQLRFSQENVLSTINFTESSKVVKAFPNPMSSSATLEFDLPQSETIQLIIYDYLGKLVMTQKYEARPGKNHVKLERGNLRSGLYLCKINSKQTSLKTLKLIVR